MPTTPISADADCSYSATKGSEIRNDDYPLEFSAVVLACISTARLLPKRSPPPATTIGICSIALELAIRSPCSATSRHGRAIACSWRSPETEDKLFHQTLVTVPSANGAHKSTNPHDEHYSPVIAGANGRIYTMFLALDENDQRAVYFCCTIDNGESLKHRSTSRPIPITASLLDESVHPHRRPGRFAVLIHQQRQALPSQISRRRSLIRSAHAGDQRCERAGRHRVVAGHPRHPGSGLGANHPGGNRDCGHGFVLLVRCRRKLHRPVLRPQLLFQVSGPSPDGDRGRRCCAPNYGGRLDLVLDRRVRRP